MPSIKGRITGENASSYADFAAQNTYQDYSQKQRETTWKQRLDEEYAYRAALEAKFGKDALNNNKKAQDLFYKYKQQQEKKIQQQQRKAELEASRALGTQTKAEKKELQAIYNKEWKAQQPSTGEKWQKSIVGAIENSAKAVGKAISKLTQQVDTYIGTYNSYAAGITTRLQGSGKTFADISNTISRNLATSPYVKQTQVLEKLNELVSAGISYNVEQRAFLSAMTDKVVATFDAADATLLRIIRLQQADSTVARMGMESMLNKFLNATYEDTSYLTDVYNNVEGSLVDAISQLDVSVGTEFEYIAQKWLGSLYSVGMGANTLTNIAEGINYLASGNVQGLSSNTQLQNLLVMGANRAGLNYASMLASGVSSADLNKLLAGVVSYAQGLAGTENLVVKNQYAQLFGLTMSDMTALLQMGDDLSYVIEQELDYADAIAETKEQLRTVGSRVPLATMIENVFDNVMYSAAMGIAGNAGTYVTWLVTNLVEQATGGINIPSIGAFVAGTGVNLDLNTTVTQLMKTGLIGFSMLGQIGNIISSIFSRGGLNLSAWGATDYTSRGTGFTGITAGVQETTSQSLTVGNSSGSDIASGSITQAQSQATQSISGTEQQGEDITQEIRDNVATIADILNAIFDGNNSIRVSMQNYGLTSSTSTL